MMVTSPTGMEAKSALNDIGSIFLMLVPLMLIICCPGLRPVPPKVPLSDTADRKISVAAALVEYVYLKPSLLSARVFVAVTDKIGILSIMSLLSYRQINKRVAQPWRGRDVHLVYSSVGGERLRFFWSLACTWQSKIVLHLAKARSHNRAK